jgi:hypothetical protein
MAKRATFIDFYYFFAFPEPEMMLLGLCSDISQIRFSTFPDLGTTYRNFVESIFCTAVCHDSKTKKSTRQSFFNFQENLNEAK